MSAVTCPLRPHLSLLLDLNAWYRNYVHENQIRTIAFCEMKPIPPGFIVVEQGDADPGVPHAGPHPLDEDHRTICKPASRQSELHRKMITFIRECFDNSSTTKYYNLVDGKAHIKVTAGILQVIGCPCLDITIISRSDEIVRIRDVEIRLHGNSFIEFLRSHERAFNRDLNYKPINAEPGPYDYYAVSLLPAKPKPPTDSVIVETNDSCHFFIPSLGLPITFAEAPLKDVSIVVVFADDGEQDLLSGAVVVPVIADIINQTKQGNYSLNPSITIEYKLHFKTRDQANFDKIGTYNTEPIEFPRGPGKHEQDDSTHENVETEPNQRLKRERDVATLRMLLAELPFTLLDAHVNSLPGRVPADIFHFWEGFHAIWKSSITHVFRQELRDILSQVHDSWESTLEFGEDYEQSNSGESYIFNWKHGIRGVDQERLEQHWNDIAKAAETLRSSMRNLIEIINSKYVEIDVHKTTAEALERYRLYSEAFEQRMTGGSEPVS